MKLAHLLPFVLTIAGVSAQDQFVRGAGERDLLSGKGGESGGSGKGGSVSCDCESGIFEKITCTTTCVTPERNRKMYVDDLSGNVSPAGGKSKGDGKGVGKSKSGGGKGEGGSCVCPPGKIPYTRCVEDCVPAPEPTRKPTPGPVAPEPTLKPTPGPVPAPVPGPVPAPVPGPVPAPVPAPEPNCGAPSSTSFCSAFVPSGLDNNNRNTITCTAPAAPAPSPEPGSCSNFPSSGGGNRWCCIWPDGCTQCVGSPSTDGATVCATGAGRTLIPDGNNCPA